MALIMAVVGALTTIACVAVAGVPVRWLEEMEQRRGGCHQCCCGKSRERSGRRAMGRSTTELSNRSLLGGDDEGKAGGDDGFDEREAESKRPSAGAIGSTLETPLLQGGSGGGDTGEFGNV